MSSPSKAKKGQGDQEAKGPTKEIKKLKDRDSLYDGFREIFAFPVHKLDVKGFCFLGEDVRHSDGIKKEAYVSWDIKQLVHWEKLSIEDEPRAIHTIKYEVTNLICCAVFISKLKIFVCAALDMTFRIYDKRLNFLETISHEERAILHMEYDPKDSIKDGKDKDILIVGGASGVSVWRIFRNTNVDINHTMEKMYFFEGFSGWVNRMIYEPYSNRVYAIVNETINILSFKRRSCVAKLEKIHNAPVTAVIWYGRSQFYVTGCSLGHLKCWSPHFTKASKDKHKQYQDPAKYEDEDGIPRHQTPGVNNFALLHTFNAHAKAITGLVLHPISGLAISTSMDGYLKVFNLENLTELFAIDNGHPIDAMKIIPYSTAYDFTGKTVVGRGCLFSQPDGTMKLWHITSLCDFFGVCNSILKSVYVFENLHLDIETKMRKLPPNGNAIHYKQNKDLKCVVPRVVVGQGSHDLRAFHGKFIPSCFMDPDSVVNGIIDFTISVYLQLMYVLLEIGVVRVYCMRTINTELVKDIQLRNELDIRDCTCIALVDVIPSVDMRPETIVVKRDLRREEVPPYIVEQLVIGTKSGTLFFLNMLNDSEISWLGQVHYGPILEVKYRRPRDELVLLLKDVRGNVDVFSVKVYKASTMVLTHELGNMHNITGFNISPTQSLFGLGCDDGYCRLYQLSGSDSSCHEILSQSVTHDASVVSLAFNDTLRVYCSCASDSTVCVWDYDKQLIRRLKFHIPTYRVATIQASGFPEGTFMLTQGYYILYITRKTWDEGGILSLGSRLELMKDGQAEWTSDWTQEMINNLDIKLDDLTTSTLGRGKALKIKGSIISGSSSMDLVSHTSGGGMGAASSLPPGSAPLAKLKIQVAPNDMHFIGKGTLSDDRDVEGAFHQTVQLNNGKVPMDLFRDIIDYWGVSAVQKFEQEYGDLSNIFSNTGDFRKGGNLKPKVTHKTQPHAIPSINFSNFTNKVMKAATKERSSGAKSKSSSNAFANSRLETLDADYLLEDDNECANVVIPPYVPPTGSQIIGEMTSETIPNTTSTVSTANANINTNTAASAASMITSAAVDNLSTKAPTRPTIGGGGGGGGHAPSDRYRTFLSPRARLTLLNSAELVGVTSKSERSKEEERDQMDALIDSLKAADYFDPNYSNQTFDEIIKTKEKQLNSNAAPSISASEMLSINHKISKVVVFGKVFNEYVESKQSYIAAKSTRTRLLNEYSRLSGQLDSEEKVEKEVVRKTRNRERGQGEASAATTSNVINVGIDKNSEEDNLTAENSIGDYSDEDPLVVNSDTPRQGSIGTRTHHHHHHASTNTSSDRKDSNSSVVDKTKLLNKNPNSMFATRTTLIGGVTSTPTGRRMTQKAQELDKEEEALRKIENIINKKNKFFEEGMSEEGQKTLQALHTNTNIRKRNNT